jgi:hypothetical protein
MDNDDLDLIIEPKAELVSKMVYLVAPGSLDGLAPVTSALRSSIHGFLQTLPLFCSSESSETFSPSEIRSPLSPLSPDIKAANPDLTVGVGLMHETAATRATQELQELYSKFDLTPGITSPTLQSVAAPALPEALASGPELNPELAIAGITLLTEGAASESVIPVESLTTAAQVSNHDFLNSMFQAGPPESGAMVQQPSISGFEASFERFGMPSGSSAISPSLQSVAAPALPAVSAISDDSSIALFRSLGSLAPGTRPNRALSADIHVPVVSMELLENQDAVPPLSPPKSPLKNRESCSPQKSILDCDALQPPEMDLVVADETRDLCPLPISKRKQSAFGSIGDFLTGFISKKADRVRSMSSSVTESLAEDLNSNQSVGSPPPPSYEPDTALQLDSDTNPRQYQLIRLPIFSAEKTATAHPTADSVTCTQQVEGIDSNTNESKSVVEKLVYDKLLDALCEQQQSPQLCVVIVCDFSVANRESKAIRASQSVVSEPMANVPSAPYHASSVVSSRATSPLPLVSDMHYWRTHMFLDQQLVSQHTSRPGFEQVEQECVAKCSLFRWDKFDADPNNDILSAKFRDIVKFGVPMAFRRPIWLRLSGLKEEELPALQELYCNRLTTYLGENGPIRIIRYLPHFGQQILWENAHLINESGRNAAFRILTVAALVHQTKLAFFPMLQDLVGCLLCFLSESETYFVIDGLIKMELARMESRDESFPIVLLSTSSESLIAGLVIECLRQDMKDTAHLISQVTLDIDGRPCWDSACPYLWGMLQGWLRNVWVGHAPLDLAFRSVDLILMRAFDQLALLKLAVLEHLSTAVKVCESPSNGESNHGAGIMPMFKALNNITPSEIHSVAQRGLFDLKINPVKALARVLKHKVNPPVAASPLAPKSVRSGPKFLGDYTIHYLPKPLPSSSIVKDEHFEFIWKHLDERFRPSEDVRRVFNSREHGLSLTVGCHFASFSHVVD